MERSFQVTFRILNDENRAVLGAEVGVTFESNETNGESVHNKRAVGISNMDGLVTLAGKSPTPVVRYSIMKEGYYSAWGSSYQFTESRFSRWHPWNPLVEVRLKQKRNPIPMYAKRIVKGLPVLGEQVSYDLEAGDWLPPHGNGRRADFVFRGNLKKADRDSGDYELVISFSNPGDGIQRFKPEPENISFRSPYLAPAEDYHSEWTLKQSRRPNLTDVTDFDPRAGYFFRVRCTLDANGKLASALYGKIYGDFFDMVYYLNPDGTRNMEYDPKRNLLKTPNNRDHRYYEVGP